ncbi:hypothetical protein [Streptomyces sulphureus]|nr:hypothetical protein [Streptomyces sulphureus]
MQGLIVTSGFSGQLGQLFGEPVPAGRAGLGCVAKVFKGGQQVVRG